MSGFMLLMGAITLAFIAAAQFSAAILLTFMMVAVFMLLYEADPPKREHKCPGSHS